MIYLIRHGETQLNAAWRKQLPTPRVRDPRLTDNGRQQAQELAARLGKIHFDIVFVSPNRRALETALYLPIPPKRICVNALFREILSGVCDFGSPPTVLRSRYRKLDFSAIDNSWWQQRGGSATRLRDVLRLLAPWKGRTIAIIAHRRFFQTFFGIGLENCEVRCIGWNSLPARLHGNPKMVKH